MSGSHADSSYSDIDSALVLTLMREGRWCNLDKPAAPFWQDLGRAIRCHGGGPSNTAPPADVIGRPAALPPLVYHRNALARLCRATPAYVQRQRLAYHADWLLSLLGDARQQDPPSGPLVSVVIPVFNRADTIAEAVGCCLKQTYRPLEIIVVDDGSTEDIAAALQPVLSRIRLLRQEPNRGAGAARNLGIREARGTLIHFLDADDLLEADAIARKVEALAAIADADLVFSGASQTGLGLHERQVRLRFLEPPNGEADCPTRDLLAVMTKGYPFLTSTVLVARWRLYDVGLFDSVLRRHQDTELFFRLALRPIKAIGILGLPTHRRVTLRSLSSSVADDRYSARLRARCLVNLASATPHWQRHGASLLETLFQVDLFEALALDRRAGLPHCRRDLLRSLGRIRRGAAGLSAAAALHEALNRGLQSLAERRPSLAHTAFYKALNSL